MHCWGNWASKHQLKDAYNQCGYMAFLHLLLEHLQCIAHWSNNAKCTYYILRISSSLVIHWKYSYISQEKPSFSFLFYREALAYKYKAAWKPNRFWGFVYELSLTRLSPTFHSGSSFFFLGRVKFSFGLDCLSSPNMKMSMHKRPKVLTINRFWSPVPLTPIHNSPTQLALTVGGRGWGWDTGKCHASKLTWGDLKSRREDKAICMSMTCFIF